MSAVVQRSVDIRSFDVDAAIASARAHMRRNELDTARGLLEDALSWARARHNTSTESMVLAVSATLAMRSSDYPTAAALGEEALLNAGPYANARASAEACLTLSMVYADIDLDEEAMRLAEDARTFAKRANDVCMLSWAHTRLADARRLKQTLHGIPVLSQVMADYRRARQLAKLADEPDPMIAVLNNLMRTVAGVSIAGHGLIPPLPKRVIRLAVLAGERATAIVKKDGHLQGALVVEPNYGAVLCKAGRFEEGKQLLERCIARARSNPNCDVYYPLVCLGEAHVEIGQYAEGKEMLLEALQLEYSSGFVTSGSHIRNILYRAAKERGDDAEALLQLELASRARQMQVIEQTKIRETIDARVRRLRDALWQVAHARMDAETDPLTSVFNRRGLPEKLAAAAHVAGMEKLPYAVAMIDIDYFKKINDVHGHVVGDQVLKAVAHTLKENCREHDLLSRYGGDEFVLGVIGATKSELAVRCEQLRHAVHTIPLDTLGLSRPVAISVGVAELSEASETGALLQLADTRLYNAKRNGRNRVDTGSEEDVADLAIPAAQNTRFLSKTA
jgi:diguanylate cyclase (GGDEF)-like protein